MATKNPLGKIKDLTVDTLKHPIDAAGKAAGQARGAASVGKHLAGQATSLTAGAVSKLLQGKKLTITPAPEPAPRPGPAARPAAAKSEPVNVTEELGLDPAPVAKPEVTDATATPVEGEPVTAIDAAADVEHVDVTPADVAKKVARKAPARKPAAKKAPAAKKPAPAGTTSPGAKLPPRKKVETTEPADSTSGSDKG